MKPTVQALIILFVSILFGIGSNFINPNRIALTGEIKTVKTTKSEILVDTPDAGNPKGNGKNGLLPNFDSKENKIHVLSIEKAHSIYNAGIATFIDARYPNEYNSGHIKGSINLTADLFDENTEFSKRVGFDDPIVIYCSGPECDLSMILAELIKTIGYKKIMVFEEGFPKWCESGFPIEGQCP